MIYKDKVYELVEIRNRVKHHHREITYLCIDEDCKAVAFRLFVTDGGEYMKLQKFNSKKIRRNKYDWRFDALDKGTS